MSNGVTLDTISVSSSLPLVTTTLPIGTFFKANRALAITMAELAVLNAPSTSNDGEGIWLQRTGVRKEILALVEQHNREDEVPPFSGPELFVMAVLCSPEESLEAKDVLRWIIKSFSYYRDLALDAYAASAMGGDCQDAAEMVIDDFDEALNSWEAPLIRANTEENALLTAYADRGTLFTVPLGAGRIFLSQWLEPTRTGTFPLLRLPAELRNSVYEMGFSLPMLEIDYYSSSPGHGVALYQRELDDFRKRGDLAVPDGDTLKSAPMQKILALLSTNKQIYNEAMPFFYKINSFYFHNIRSLRVFTTRVPSDRLQHVSHLHISYGGPQKTHLRETKPALAALAQLDGLRTLRINVYDQEWLTMSNKDRLACGRSSKFTKPAQLPGIRDLIIVASKAQNLKLEGMEWGGHGSPGTRIATYLEAEVKKLKASKAESKPVGSGKKKAEALDPDGGNAGSARKRAKTGR
ncbi:hypothetical protein LTR37_021184 [Vermiconidia calcicola]|uniref:Uncharacterized protein n=1 Tax=Vermiconidia calcicola TaxID=1690605 RepID=A0ACC3M957_9PEZI|nr:hypothetical protein LTR37_021184 [Vermiconidia calcicola]